MKFILVFLSSATLALACDDKASIMQTCLADTPEFASRLGSALEACGVVTGAQDRIELLSEKCPSSMSIMMKFGMRYRDEVCVFQAIGWMDDAGEMVEDVVVADVTTFPTDVQDALAIPNLQECVGQFMDSLMSKPETQTCLPTYSEEDSQLIQGLAVGAGHIECFVAIFEAACADYAGCLNM